MIEVLLAALLVLLALFARKYRALRKPAALDGKLTRRAGRVRGYNLPRVRAALNPLDAFLAAFLGLHPQLRTFSLVGILPPSGFTVAGVPVNAEVAKIGTTTSLGTTTQLNDTTLTGTPSFKGLTVLILSGNNQYQTRAITANAAGSLTVSPPFDNAVASGVQYAVLCDPVGTVYNAVQQLLGEAGLVATQSLGPDVVDASSDALSFFAQYINDRVNGAIASANINIGSATVTLSKSHANGAFSTAGVTQPTLSKANGVVSCTPTFKAAEWAIGDDWQLVITGVAATDAQGNVEQIQTSTWIGKIDTDTTVGGNVATIKSTVGAATDSRFYETAQTDQTTRTVVNLFKGLSSALIAWQSAATGAGTTTTIVDSGLTTTDYTGHVVVMVGGTAANLGVARRIQSISGSTITVLTPFPAATANTDKYAILSTDVWRQLTTTGTGTVTAAGGTAEVAIIDQATPVGGMTQAFMDLSALTQNATIRLYRKIDGTNYRVMKKYPTFVPGTSDPGFYTDLFLTRNGFKLTIQPASAEAADRSVPYEILNDPRA